jgi:hypothetical protein
VLAVWSPLAIPGWIRRMRRRWGRRPQAATETSIATTGPQSGA